jgi:sec-independent protein translocase protein TatC
MNENIEPTQEPDAGSDKPKRKSSRKKVDKQDSSGPAKPSIPKFDYPNVYSVDGTAQETSQEKPKSGSPPRKPRKKSASKVSRGNPERKMSFLEHLEELRWTLFRSIIAICVGMTIAYIFSNSIVDFLRKPAPADLKLVFLGPTEAFMIYLKVSMFAGIVFSLPYIAYEFWKFIVPGLLEKERKVVPTIVFYTLLCFVIGAAFAYYFIIPFAIQFLLSYQDQNLVAAITIGKYLGFVVTMILCFGVVFELPVLAFLLTQLGILTPEFLISKRRYGIVGIFIVAAILTPPDVFSQMMMAIPLLVLYEVSIVVSKIVRDTKVIGKKNKLKRPLSVNMLCRLFITFGFLIAGAATMSRYFPLKSWSLFSYLSMNPLRQFYGFSFFGLLYVVAGWVALHGLKWGRIACLSGYCLILIYTYFHFGPSALWTVFCVMFGISVILLFLPSVNLYYSGKPLRKTK